jgi:hypothetical protein
MYTNGITIIHIAAGNPIPFKNQRVKRDSDDRESKFFSIGRVTKARITSTIIDIRNSIF